MANGLVGDTQVVIGGYVLSEFEIPEKINIGGEQILVEQILIGGSRTIDAMGAKPDPISWKGQFRGPGALQRALAIDEMRIAGAEIDFSFFNVAKTVVIKKFKADVEKFYEVPYEITVEVVTDDSGFGISDPAGALEGLINADMLSATGDADGTVPGITSALAPLQAAVTASTGFTQASNADLAAFGTVVQTTAAQLGSIASSAEAAIDPNEGMLAGTDPDIMVAWMTNQGTNVETESQALDVSPYVNRMALNLANVGN